MKYFELPDSPKTRCLNLQTLRVQKEHPEWFVDDTEIDAVYGCPTGCIWNGGCINFEEEHLSSDEIKHIFDQYNALGVGYRLTFTNRLLEGIHLNDAVGNEVLRLGNNDMNAVIVANDTMENYIRRSFPRLKVI